VGAPKRGSLRLGTLRCAHHSCVAPEYTRRRVPPKQKTPAPPSAGAPPEIGFVLRNPQSAIDRLTTLVFAPKIQIATCHVPNKQTPRCQEPRSWGRQPRIPEYHISQDGILDFSPRNAIPGNRLGISAASAVSPWPRCSVVRNRLSDLAQRECRRRRRPTDKLILDMDSSVSSTYGQQEGTAYNGHFGCECYHPLFLFNQDGTI
jgi:hypothetical protein